MSKETLINQGRLVYESLSNIDRTTLTHNPENLQPWNQLVFDDFVVAFDDMVKMLQSIYENDILKDAPYNIINAMNTNLNNTLQHCNAFVSNRAQSQFQNAFQHVEAMRTNMQTWGLRYEAIIGKEIEERSRLIDEEISKLLSNKTEIEALKTSVSRLIEPAVAGSLSQSFTERKTVLHENQDRWFWASVITAGLSIIATIVIVWSVVGMFTADEVLKAIENSKNGTEGVIWTTIGLRVGVLIPIFSVFVFSFLQYKRERDLEEEYAHKAAVATSLPNYGGLAVEDSVKDQILSEASKVIFTSPSSRDKSNNKSGSIGINQLNSILSNIQKFLPKSKE